MLKPKRNKQPKIDNTTIVKLKDAPPWVDSRKGGKFLGNIVLLSEEEFMAIEDGDKIIVNDILFRFEDSTKIMNKNEKYGYFKSVHGNLFIRNGIKGERYRHAQMELSIFHTLLLLRRFTIEP